MKNKSGYYVIIGMIACFCLLSCESQDEAIINNDTFTLEFSDGTVLDEDNLQFYDTSTRILFLNSNLNLRSGTTDFDAKVNGHTIYHGILYSCFLSSFPTQPYFISDCFPYGNNIIEIRSNADPDLRNDPQILSALNENGLIRNGLSCSIVSVIALSFENHSEIECTIRIKNNDRINYYIPDPAKMGELDFNYYTGGLVFQNMETHVSSFLKWSVPSPDWHQLTMGDLTILSGGSELEYTFSSTDYYALEKGVYSARFRFPGVNYNAAEFGLSLKKGRIWLGDAIAELDSILVD